MSLSVALNTARSSLLTTSTQIAVSGANTSGALDPSYSRKIAMSVTAGDGSVRIVSIGRAADTSLYYRMLDATSRTAASQARLEGLDKLHQTVGDTEDARSPAARLGKLLDALNQYANAPQDKVLAGQVLSQASGLVTTLNEAAKTVTTTRQEADAEIAKSVSRVNDLLSQFEELNRAVVKGTATGADVTDLLDKRDMVLAQISEEIGVNVVTRENNDMVLYTDGGVTLFETSARKVEFTPTLVYGATTVGNQVVIDGVPVTGNTTMPLRSGRIVGLMEVRDVTTVAYQNQLDEIARAVIDIFDTGTAAGGLFTQVGLPAGGGLRPGLAADIRINAAYDPDQGGSLDELRDGDTNPTGEASYSARLFELIDRFNATRGFDPAAGIQTSGSLVDFSSSSVGWLEARRSSAQTDAAYQETVLARASDALSTATGVNLDDELALQLQLERSYSAASRLIAVIDEMLRSLLEAVR
ncbi:MULTISPECIES: flagellar hook-associated protein FlgK [Chelatococcus]|uniref:Flagellar hook-associated protein 1 n=1 Tax=Chelatococcus caeni TaxID=1348468 RepID=A0A840C2H5_9HYPH|nr:MULTISPECIES: flagellar hook-associated protein FlgK [Chelatococcus]ALA16746.1 hypothetical protein AL346_04105 [Chelatococcus sp. CO-6]MBB4019784.1 flagellar hook-associated protein 1 FlgK [Chelatococcus caeni]